MTSVQFLIGLIGSLFGLLAVGYSFATDYRESNIIRLVLPTFALVAVVVIEMYRRWQ